MHIPVLFCGLICGWQSGAVVGFVLPPLRYVLFTCRRSSGPVSPCPLSWLYMEPLLARIWQLVREIQPIAVRIIRNLYLALIGAMLAGRIVWGLVRFILARVTMQPFTMEMFIERGIPDCNTRNYCTIDSGILNHGRTSVSEY